MTSLIIRNELNLHGVSVHDIQRIEDRAEATPCTTATTDPSVETGLSTEGTPSTQAQSELTTTTDNLNLFSIDADKTTGESTGEAEPETGDLEA